MSRRGMETSRSVFFYTGSFTHTFYKEIFRYPPDGYAFIPSSPDLTSGGMKKDIALSKRWYFPYLMKAERTAVATLSGLRMPKVRRIKTPACDLIHSAQYPLLNRQPWVLDFEDVTAFTWYRNEVLKNQLVKSVLERLLASSWCRAVLPWTEAARKSLEYGLNCDSFRHKIRVAYPVMSPQPDIEAIMAEKRTAKKTKILFIGTTFYTKGGVEALAVADVLSKHYPIEFVMISNVPDEYRRRYADHPSIRLLSKIPQDEVRHHYRTSHIFFAPYHTDTFGFVILEGFSYGLPCIATDQFAIPEIVRHGSTGLVVTNSISRFDKNFQATWPPVMNKNHGTIQMLQQPENSYLERLKQAFVQLLENTAKREQMAEAAYREVKTGRFAPTTRMATMKQVYDQAFNASHVSHV